MVDQFIQETVELEASPFHKIFRFPVHYGGEAFNVLGRGYPLPRLVVRDRALAQAGLCGDVQLPHISRLDEVEQLVREWPHGALHADRKSRPVNLCLTRREPGGTIYVP